MRRCSLFASDGVTTRYACDAAGRLVKEGGKTYRYGYLDKVMSVTDGDTTRTYTYHADGQLASAMVGSSLRGDSSAMVGLALDFESIEDDLKELSRCIDEYGRDTVWTIDFGQIIYNMTYSSETGALYVYE